jgi:hypothetical protein
MNERVSPYRGYDAAEDKIVNMFEAGIIDPLKVVRTGLSDARYGFMAGDTRYLLMVPFQWCGQSLNDIRSMHR